MGASNYKLIAKAIADELREVAEIGRVHEFQRVPQDLARYLDFFRYTPAAAKAQVRGWIVTRESASEGLGSASAAAPGSFTPAGTNRRTHTFLLLGVMGLEDGAATELVFQDLVEAVCDHFRDNAALQLLDAQGVRRVATLERLMPPQVDAIEPRQFGPMLSHVAEIRIQAVERIVRA